MRVALVPLTFQHAPCVQNSSTGEWTALGQHQQAAYQQQFGGAYAIATTSAATAGGDPYV